VSTNQALTLPARLFSRAVIIAGIVSGAWQIAHVDPLGGHWTAVLILGGLGALAPLTTVRYVSKLPTGIAHQVSSTFIYALLAVANPGMACIAVLIVTVSDQVVFRRNLLHAAFNLGNLWISLGVASLVRRLLLQQTSGELTIALAPLGAAVATMVAFALVNHALTITVVSLVNRTPILLRKWIAMAGVYNELQCLVSGLSMAIFWVIHPALILLIALPVFGVSLLLARLAGKERNLEVSASELHSLQNLGLELGKELDEDRLEEAILRIACQALEAPSALLALQDEDRSGLRVTAHRGLSAPAPDRLEASLEELRLPESGAALLRGEREIPKSLRTIGTYSPSMLVAGLTILDRPAGILVLSHDFQRRSFDRDDLAHLETLVRFINVSLSNARWLADRRELENQIRQNEKLSALGIMVSGVAHELNNPLTSIMGYAELLLPEEDDGRRHAMLSRIGSESRRAGKIVQNLLTFSRRHKPERSAVDLNRLCDELVEFREHEMKIRHIEFDLRLSRDLPTTFADAHQLQQVLINLVSNAEQAIEDTGRSGVISLETRTRGNTIQLDVSDDGPGMATEIAENAFLPFFTTKEVGRGTGLGLSICYGIIQEHDGHIDVDSSVESGTTFRITLPIVEADAAPVAVKEASTTPHTLAFRGRILVVDDESSILQGLSDFFLSAGWTVISARSGAEALEAVDTFEFDVLVVDLRMPGMDGISFYEWLGRVRPDLLSRVIFTTRDTGSPTTTEFLASLDNHVLMKPFEIEDLDRLIGGIVRSTGDPPIGHGSHSRFNEPKAP